MQMGIIRGSVSQISDSPKTGSISKTKDLESQKPLLFSRLVEKSTVTKKRIYTNPCSEVVKFVKTKALDLFGRIVARLMPGYMKIEMPVDSDSKEYKIKCMLNSMLNKNDSALNVLSKTNDLGDFFTNTENTKLVSTIFNSLTDLQVYSIYEATISMQQLRGALSDNSRTSQVEQQLSTLRDFAHNEATSRNLLTYRKISTRAVSMASASQEIKSLVSSFSKSIQPSSSPNLRRLRKNSAPLATFGRTASDTGISISTTTVKILKKSDSSKTLPRFTSYATAKLPTHSATMPDLSANSKGFQECFKAALKLDDHAAAKPYTKRISIDRDDLANNLKVAKSLVSSLKITVWKHSHVLDPKKLLKDLYQMSLTREDHSSVKQNLYSSFIDIRTRDLEKIYKDKIITPDFQNLKATLKILSEAPGPDKPDWIVMHEFMKDIQQTAETVLKRFSPSFTPAVITPHRLSWTTDIHPENQQALFKFAAWKKEYDVAFSQSLLEMERKQLEAERQRLKRSH